MHYKLYEEDHDKDYNPESDSESEYESESEGMRTIKPFLIITWCHFQKCQLIEVWKLIVLHLSLSEDAETIVDAKVAISTEVVESTVDSNKGTSPEGVEENIAEEEEAEFTDEEYESDEEGLETEVEELISSQQEYAKLNPEQKKKWEDIKAQTAQKDWKGSTMKINFRNLFSFSMECHMNSSLVLFRYICCCNFWFNN